LECRCKKKLSGPVKINDILYAKHIVKHFFGVDVETEKDLILYWNSYRRFKIEEGTSLHKVMQR